MIGSSQIEKMSVTERLQAHNSMNRARPEWAIIFLDSILSDLDSLVLFAGVHAIYFGFHRMLSTRFPFAIYYEAEGDVVYVYAILDLHRRVSQPNGGRFRSLF